ncbi:Asp-tRNA(Asn)/Glu-tRNA(Gln) amidotransferase subunit GatC [Candidatus Peregrinibacteria bacterium]|nr:Asp-tRNA(Asn)/Glu-tRNA(Gln) amidotransferase subunit GatC [Candidatus Peregrinibacteria bacterium]MBT7345446.1 Asp-tRNA(Asn)/Glu-tRNA(Gln) amidotransferase subunit GatC [Candidatus Peregrinibacteria bacterium]
MAKLEPKDVRHIAKLARLSLSEEEVEKFSTELTSILDYLDNLQELDTDGVEPTAQVTGQHNSFREDALLPDEKIDPDALLECSPLPITEHQIQTPSAHGTS